MGDAPTSPMVHDGTPMVVSSSHNRYHDVQPYCYKLYKSDPAKYSSIFPEDVPQDPTNPITEQKWLREWFGDREIQVQGGDPGGFRFLKQVLTSCALWNELQRVPGLVRYWFAQKANQDILDDPSMYSYLCSDATLPSAFFPSAELQAEGERALRRATDVVQKHIRDGTRPDTAKLTLSDGISAAEGVSPKTVVAAPISPGEKTDYDFKTNPHSHQPTPMVKASVPVQSVGTPSISEEQENVITRAVTSGMARMDSAMDHQPRQARGGATARRGSFRNTQKPSYHQQLYYQHPQHAQQSTHLYSTHPAQSPTPYGSLPVTMRSSSSAPMHFGQQSPQVAAVQSANAPYPHRAPPGLQMQYPTHQQGPQPVWVAQSQMQQANFPTQFAVNSRNDEHYSHAALNNDTSTISRGGRSRGFTGGSVRGKGSRRFSGEQRQPFGLISGDARRYVGDVRQTSGDYGMPVHSARGNNDRRLSIKSDWRSKGGQQTASKQENLPPSRNSSVSFPPDPGFTPIHDPVSEAGMKNPAQVVTRTSIGVACSHVNKLILFAPYSRVSESEVRRHFRGLKYTTPGNSSASTPGDQRGTTIWLTFENHVEAQNALHEGVSRWKGPEIRLEVPMCYWQPTHGRYPGFEQGKPDQGILLRQPSPYQATQAPRAASQDMPSTEITPTPKDHATSSGSKQTQRSGDTTPTPSASNTPKKDMSRGKSKKQKQQHQSEQHRISVNDLPQLNTALPCEDGARSESDQTGVSPFTKPGDDLAEDTGTTDTTIQSALVNDALDSRKTSTSSETAQTRSEPAFSPEIQVKAQLPPFTRQAQHGATAIATGADSPASLAVSGPHEGTSSVPHMTHLLKKSEDDKIDDSFHTAASSPDTPQQPQRTPGAVKAHISTPVAPNAGNFTPVDESSRNESKGEADPPQEDKSTSLVPKADRKDLKKAITPQKPLSVKIAEPIAISSTEKSRKPSDSQRSASALSVPPTPAFFTAPSTPAMKVDTPTAGDLEEKTSGVELTEKTDGASTSPLSITQPKTEGAVGTEATSEAGRPPGTGNPPKAEEAEASGKVVKAEKAKGPSKTESLNPFAKPAQKKKAKAKSRKGTMKGRPKVEDFGEGNSSRSVSGVMTPNTPDDSTAATPATETPATEIIISGGSAVDQVQEVPAITSSADNEAERDAVKPVSNTFGSFLQGFFTQPPASLPKDMVGSEEKPKTTLSPTKHESHSTDIGEPVPLEVPKKQESPSQGSPSQEGASQPDDAPGASGASETIISGGPAVDQASRLPFRPFFRPFPEGHDGSDVRDSGDSGGGNPSGDADVGLGISTAGDLNEEAPKAKKKKPKKRKKKSNVGDEGGTVTIDGNDAPRTPPSGVKYELPSTPFSFEAPVPIAAAIPDTGSIGSPSTFTPGFTAPNAPMVDDKISESSSSTMAADDTPWPRSKRALFEIRKAQQAGSSVVQAKPFPKGLASKRKAPFRPTAVLGEDENGQVELFRRKSINDDEGDGESGESGESPSDHGRRFVYLYVGPGKAAEHGSPQGFEHDKLGEDLPALMESVKQRRLGGNDENARPGGAAGRGSPNKP